MDSVRSKKCLIRTIQIDLGYLRPYDADIMTRQATMQGDGNKHIRACDRDCLTSKLPIPLQSCCC